MNEDLKEAFERYHVLVQAYEMINAYNVKLGSLFKEEWLEALQEELITFVLRAAFKKVRVSDYDECACRNDIAEYLEEESYRSDFDLDELMEFVVNLIKE